MKIDALVLAGGLMTPEDPLYSENGEGRRSLIELHGKPMVQWVIDALSASRSIGEIFVIGLSEMNGLSSSKTLHYLPDEGGLFENMRSGVLEITRRNPEQSKVMIASGDIPAIQPHMVDWLAQQVVAAPDFWIYYNVIPQAVMEDRFPDANRSFVRFKDIAVCGGDLNVVDKRLYTSEQPVWEKLTAARKNPVRQMLLLGVDSLILIALRLLSLEKAVQRVCKKLSIKGKALVSPYAEIGMDADKPNQLALLRDDLKGRS